jgi:hypothetical protein
VDAGQKPGGGLIVGPAGISPSGVRLNKRLRGKLSTVIDQIEHGHHVFRAYWKNAFLNQYEKFARFCTTSV